MIIYKQNMKFFRNPNVTIAVFAVYTAAMYAIFMPKNNEVSVTEKWITAGVSIAVLALLWVLLRKREKLRREREKEMQALKEERRNKIAENTGEEPVKKEK